MSTYDVVILGAGPRRLQRSDPRRAVGLESGMRGRPRHPRRDLPERRLHAVQGIAACL